MTKQKQIDNKDLLDAVKPTLALVNTNMLPNISDDTTYQVARVKYNEARDVLDAAEKIKQENFLAPLKTAINNITTTMNNIEHAFNKSATPLIAYVALIKESMHKFVCAEIKERQLEAESFALKLEKKNLRQEAAQVRDTASGTSNFGNVTRLQELVIDETKVPAQYWRVDRGAIAAAYKKNPDLKIPGVSFVPYYVIVKR